jgi:adenylate cyclase
MQNDEIYEDVAGDEENKIKDISLFYLEAIQKNDSNSLKIPEPIETSLG